MSNDQLKWLLLAVALVGCRNPGDVKVKQYDTVPAPVVGQGVRIYLGDVELGRHAEIRVTAPNGDVLGHGDLEVGDELPFRYRGKAYVVSPTRYEDHTLHEDLGFLRVAQRARSPRADVVEIAEGGTGPMPGRPDEAITVGTIELDRLVDLSIRTGGGERREAIGVGERVGIASDHAEYSLVLIAVAFEPDGVDHAYLRFRPGRGD